MRIERVDCWWMSFVFLLSSPPRLSSVIVLLEINASLNDAAPASPILLSVYLLGMEKSGLLMDAICVLFLSY